MLKSYLKNSHAIDLFFVLLVTPLLLLGCFDSSLLPYDDFDHVMIPAVRGPDPWYSAFIPQEVSTYFPISTLSYRFEKMVYEDLFGIINWAPFARVDSLLVHMASGVALWLLCRRVGLGRAGILLVTGGFLLTPLACESICWVSERKNVLCAFFSILALHAAVSLRHPLRPFASAACYLLGVFSKPAALGFMPVLFLFEILHAYGWTDFKEKRREKPDRRENLLSLAGLALVLAGTLVSLKLNLHGHEKVIVTPPGGTVFTAILTDAQILRRYMQSLVVPFDLSFFYYEEPVLSLTDLRFWLNALAVVAIVGITIGLSRRRGITAFCWFWFFAGLGPLLNLIAISFVRQDRYLYLSTPAFFGALALAFEGVGETKPDNTLESGGETHWPRTASASATTGVILVYGFLAALVVISAERAPVFGNPLALFQDAANKQPKSAYAHLHCGLALAKAADWVESQKSDGPARAEAFRVSALEHLQASCELPDFERFTNPGRPYWAIAYIQRKRGKLDEAERAARMVIDGKFAMPTGPKTIVDAYLELSRVMLARGRLEDALHETEDALKVWPDGPVILLFAGEILEQMKRPADAVAVFERIPHDTPEYRAAMVHLQNREK